MISIELAERFLIQVDYSQNETRVAVIDKVTGASAEGVPVDTSFNFSEEAARYAPTEEPVS